MCLAFIERWQINWNRLGSNWRATPAEMDTDNIEAIEAHRVDTQQCSRSKIRQRYDDDANLISCN